MDEVQDPLAPLDSRGRIPARAWLTLGILLLLYIVAMMDRQIIPMIVPPLKASLGLDNLQIALVHGVAFSLFYGVAGIPLGWAVDRTSPRLIIFCGVVVWSLSTVLSGLAGSFSSLFLFRLLVGFGEAALMPAAMALLATAFPRDRLALATSTFMAGSLIGGGTASGAIGGVLSLLGSGPTDLPLFGSLEPWRAAFVIIGAPGLLFAFAAWILPRHSPARRTIGATPPIGFLPFVRENSRFLTTHLLAFALLACCAYANNAWGPTHLMSLGWTPGQVGLGFALIGAVFGTAGTFLSAGIVDRMYRRGIADAHERYHFWVVLFSWPLAAGAYLVSDPRLFVGLLCLAYLTLFGFGGTATAALQIIAPPELRGRVASLYGLAVAVGGAALGPLMVALVERMMSGSGQDNLASATAIVIVVCALGAVVMLALARPAFIAAQARRGIGSASRVES